MSKSRHLDVGTRLFLHYKFMVIFLHYNLNFDKANIESRRLCTLFLEMLSYVSWHKRKDFLRQN